LRNTTDDNEELTRVVKELRNEVDELRKENQQLLNQDKELISDVIGKLNRENQELREKQTKSLEMKSSLTAEIQELKQIVIRSLEIRSALTDENREMRERLTHLHEDNEDLGKLASSRRKRYDDSQMETTRLENEIMKLRNTVKVDVQNLLTYLNNMKDTLENGFPSFTYFSADFTFPFLKPSTVGIGNGAGAGATGPTTVEANEVSNEDDE
jgi:chromosome segregation ATPase